MVLYKAPFYDHNNDCKVGGGGALTEKKFDTKTLINCQNVSFWVQNRGRFAPQKLSWYDWTRDDEARLYWIQIDADLINELGFR